MTTASDASPPKFELSPVNLIAGCLAAVTAAVLASFFGVAGTIIGTALGSIVGTAGTAIYTHSIRRTQRRLNTLRSHGVPTPSTAGGLHLSARNWLMIGIAAVAAFAITMTVVTGVEAAARKQLWAIVTGQKSSGPTTTVGAVTGAQAPPSTPTAKPSSSPSPGFPGVAPTQGPGTPEPTSSATPTPLPTRSPPAGSPSP
jgi:hypothetical protein